jgi:hypothetical protein
MLLACDMQMNCGIWDAGTGKLLLDLYLAGGWQTCYQVLLAGDGMVLRLGKQDDRGVCCAHASLNAVPSGSVLETFDLHLTGKPACKAQVAMASSCWQFRLKSVCASVPCLAFSACTIAVHALFVSPTQRQYTHHVCLLLPCRSQPCIQRQGGSCHHIGWHCTRR